MPRSCNSTFHLAYRQAVRFALCRFRSPLLPASRLISLPAGTEMLHFPAFPFQAFKPGMPLNAAGFPFRHPGVYGCMRLTPAYRSLPRPSSAPKPSHPPGGVPPAGNPLTPRSCGSFILMAS